MRDGNEITFWLWKNDKEIREGVKIYLQSQGYEVISGCRWD